MKKGFIKSVTATALAAVLTLSSMFAVGISIPMTAKAQVTTGQWEYQGITSWKPSTSKVTTEYSGGTEAVITTPKDQITFKGHCEFPGQTVAGGTKKSFHAYVTAHDRTFKEGFRNVIYYLAVTDSNPSDPVEDLDYITDNPYGSMFYDSKNPKGDPRITAEIDDDPLTDGSGFVHFCDKQLIWTFPNGIYPGQTMTIWFLNWGNNEERGGIGFKYKWNSGLGLSPVSDKVVDVTTKYTGTDPAWVLTSYELHPNGKRVDSSVKGAVLYDDAANKRVIAGHTVSDGTDSWTNFELEIKHPESVIKQSGADLFKVNATALGGYRRKATNYIYMSYGKNVSTWKDMGSPYLTPYDANGKDYGSSFYIDGPDEVKNMTYKVTDSMLEKNKENDTLTFSYYDWGAPWVVVFNYKWVTKGTDSDTSDTDTTPAPDTSVTKPKKATVKLSQVKGAKAKATVTKQAGATKYQIRYKVGNAKKWSTNIKASTKNTFTIKVKKGKKVYVQARAYNSAGWGAWSKTKSLKTDKK